jgi:drug/metabolite transporter (DMT)-like permease
MNLRNKTLFAVMVSMWALSWSVMKMGLNKAPPIAFVSHRFFIATTFFLILYFISKKQIPKDKQVLKKVLIYSLFMTLQFALTTIGLASQKSGVASILVHTQPIMVFILAIFFLKEPFSIPRLLGIILGFSGIASIFFEEVVATMTWASFLLIIGAFFWAVGTVYYKLELQNQDSRFVNLIQAFITLAILYLVSLTIEPPFLNWDLSYITILFYMGIGAQGVGMIIWLVLLKNEDASVLSSSVLIVPALALFLGWLLMDEAFTLNSIIGSIMVIAGIYLVNQNRMIFRSDR